MKWRPPEAARHARRTCASSGAGHLNSGPAGRAEGRNLVSAGCGDAPARATASIPGHAERKAAPPLIGTSITAAPAASAYRPRTHATATNAQRINAIAASSTPARQPVPRPEIRSRPPASTRILQRRPLRWRAPCVIAAGRSRLPSTSSRAELPVSTAPWTLTARRGWAAFLVRLPLPPMIGKLARIRQAHSLVGDDEQGVGQRMWLLVHVP